MAADDDGLSVVVNLRKMLKSWSRIARILGQEDASPRFLGVLFKAVMQAVLLLGSRYVGDYPPHGKVPGKFPAQVHQEYYRKAARVPGGWDLLVPTTRDSNGGRGFRGYGSICPEEAEYGRTVHCDAANYVPL